MSHEVRPFVRGPTTPVIGGTYDHHGYEPLINVRDDPPSRSHHRLRDIFWVWGSLKYIYIFCINLNLSHRNGQNIRQYKRDYFEPTNFLELPSANSCLEDPHKQEFLRGHDNDVARHAVNETKKPSLEWDRQGFFIILNQQMVGKPTETTR